MKNTIAIVSGSVLALALSFNAFADAGYNSDTDHDHVGNTSGEHTSGKPSMMGKMNAMRAKMQAEMQAIINTEDKAKRQAMFAAHKEKMKGMMSMMQNMQGSDCNKMQHGKSTIGHQGEAD